MRKQLTRQERACLRQWLRHRRAVRAPNLVPLPDYPGRADRYYASLGRVVAVEITRLVDPDKERAEADPVTFLRNDIAPLVEGQLPGKYFAALKPPWNIPRKNSPRRRQLAEAVAREILSRAPDTSGHLTDVSFLPDVRLSLIRASTQGGVRGLVYGGRSSLYGGWEGEERRAAKAAMETAIPRKARKGQLGGADIAWRVLVLHDLMGGGEPAVLDEVVSSLSSTERSAFDEIAVVSMWGDSRCYTVALH